MHPFMPPAGPMGMGMGPEPMPQGQWDSPPGYDPSNLQHLPMDQHVFRNHLMQMAGPAMFGEGVSPEAIAASNRMRTLTQAAQQPTVPGYGEFGADPEIAMYWAAHSPYSPQNQPKGFLQGLSDMLYGARDNYGPKASEPEIFRSGLFREPTSPPVQEDVDVMLRRLKASWDQNFGGGRPG